MEYRYQHFQRELLKEDARFKGGPSLGSPLPDFYLPTTDGGRVSKSDFVGQPMLLTFGSITCPMTAASIPMLDEYHQRYGARVRFLTVYVREAHPGDNYPQPTTMEEKIRHAQSMQQRYNIPWIVAVDDVDGPFHRTLDSKPSSAYFVDADGRIVYRSLWANDPSGLKEGFRTLLGEAPAAKRDHQRRVGPMLSGIGYYSEVLDNAGPEAKRDIMRQAPPVYLLSQIARVFKPLSPRARGIAAVLTVAAVPVLLAGLARTAFRRRRRARTARRLIQGKAAGLLGRRSWA